MLDGKTIAGAAFFLASFPPLMNAVAQGDPVYFLNGTAAATGEDCYELTSAINAQTGSVWYADQVDLSQPLDLQFTINLGSLDFSGADGICFVMQTVGTDALGESGGGLGFLGVDFQPAFAVEFDTYQNGNYGDPAQDHIAMVSNGSVDHNASTSIAGPVFADELGGNIEDGLDHDGRVTWNPEEETVRVYFDCELRLEGSIDLINDIFQGQSEVYFGFTASTGGSVNVQTVCLSANILGSAEQGFVCPEVDVQLNVPSPDGLATWEPAEYLNDASISSPICTPPSGLEEPLLYTATYTDQCGIAVVDTIQLTVEDMTANVSGVSNITCDLEQVNVLGDSNFPAPLDYEWIGPPGFINSNNASATIFQPGDFTLVVSYQDGLCEVEVPFTVPVDTVTFGGNFPDVGFLTCSDTAFYLVAESLSNDSATVSWTTANGTILGSGAAVSAAAAGVYTATVTNPNNGCEAQFSVDVSEANELPDIVGGYVEPLTCLSPGQPVLGAGVSEYAPFETGNLTPNVSWTNANNGTTLGISPSSGSFGPIINAAGSYQLVVEWQETGCADSVIITVTEGDDFGLDISSLTFPNILTANNDGKNDSWYPFLEDMLEIEALGVLTNYALRIYNRWGQVVFTNAGQDFSSGTPIRWYGNGNSGEPLASGTYWYVVDYTSTCGDSQSGSAQGVIEIVRE